MALSFGKIGGELLKPGGAMRIPSMVATELGGYIGRKIRGDEQPSYTTNIQPVQTKKVQTYNSRYPGFDEEDYNRLLQIVDSTGKTGSEKAQLMDEAYQYYYPQVLNKHKLDERQETINNWVYENGEKLANGDKLTNAQYRLLNLTQMAKEKFDIAYNVEDTQIIHNIVEKTPNGQELLTKFLDTGDPELLYATGIYDKGQEAQDFRSQKDIANEVLGGNFWKNAWNTMYANSFAPLDSAEKFLYKGIKNMQMLGTKIDDYFADKDIPEGLRKDAFGDKTAEQIRAENQEFRDTSKREIDDYINLVNNANQSNRARTVNPIVDNYYNRRNFTDLLAEGDIDGFFYKGLGDAASNRDMPIIIGASIVNPAMGTALMGTNSYVRESEEAYETMRKAGATHEQAEVGAGVVGLVNSAIEVYLDKLLGGTETTTTKGVRDAIKKNVMKEVTSKPFEEIVSSATKTYVGSSLEEGLEEWLQNIVTNAAEMTVKENPEWKDLFEGGRAAAEGGIFNPFNILAPAGDIARNTDINSIRQGVSEGVNDMSKGVNNIVEGTKNLGKNFNPSTNEALTRTYPIWQENNKLNLSKAARDIFAARGTDGGTVMLELGLANKPIEEKIVGLEEWGNEGYNNVTEASKEFNDEMVDNTEGALMAEFLADAFEKDDILSKTKKDEIAELREFAKQKEVPFSIAQQFKRDFDSKKSHAFYKANGEVKDSISGGGKEELLNLRNAFSEKINEIGDKHDVDIRSENEKVTESVVLRDALIDNMTNEERANFFKVKDVLLSTILAGGDWKKAVGYFITSKLYDKYSGKLAQSLYNLNEEAPKSKPILKKGAGFINKQGANAEFHYGLSNSNNPNGSLSNGERTLDVSNLDVGGNPLDTIQDRNVGANPTDTVISENVNETAGNQAQELYNQGDKNLSPNSEQMTEVRSYTAEELGLPPVSATMLKNLDRSKYIPVEDPKTKKVVFYKVEELEKAFQPVEETKKKTTKKGKKGDVKQYADEAYKPEIVMTEEEINNREEKNNSNEVMEDFTKTYKYNRLQADMKAAEDLFWGFMAEYHKTGIKDYMKKAQQQQNEINRIRKEIDNYIKDYDGKTKQYADNSYKPSITMTEKSINKKQAKENVNNLISDTWSEIGDEGDWDWYKKMKKKDVITYLEDQVLDEFSDARKRGYDYGLEWSEVQKLIKKFVNNKMK